MTANSPKQAAATDVIADKYRWEATVSVIFFNFYILASFPATRLCHCCKPMLLTRLTYSVEGGFHDRFFELGRDLC